MLVQNKTLNDASNDSKIIQLKVGSKDQKTIGISNSVKSGMSSYLSAIPSKFKSSKAKLGEFYTQVCKSHGVVELVIVRKKYGVNIK